MGVNTIVLSNGRTLIDKTHVYTYPTPGDYNTFNKTPHNACNISIELVTDKSGTYAALKASNGDTILHNGTKAYVFETGENYSKLLKAAYSGIKEGNPDATVLTSGSGLGYIDPEWSANRNMQEFAHGLLAQMKNENYYYFDVYATHPYHQAQAPEIVDRWIMSQDWSMQADVGNKMFETYSVPDDKALWATEFGYSARDDESDSERAMQRAAWIVRTMLLNEIGGFHDKMYLYDILNDGLDASNSEHNFGTICYCNNESWNNVTAYAAKPQYLAMAQYNKMLAGASLSDHEVTEVSGGQKRYKTTFKKDEDTVFVLWDTYNSGEVVTLSGNAEIVTVYDYFGNVIERKENPETISVTIGETPVYVEFNVIDETYIETGENISFVHIVNNYEEAIYPYVFRVVENSKGEIENISINEVTKIMPGEYKKVSCYTPEDEEYTYKIIVVRDIDKLTPMCEAKSN